MSAAEAAALARRAAEIVQERGHTKGRGMDSLGRVCLWGAVTVASDEVSHGYTHSATLTPALRCLLLEQGEVDVDPIRWNDAPETTGTDVAKLLLQVADRLEIAP
jgi:hypothetical protein